MRKEEIDAAIGAARDLLAGFCPSLRKQHTVETAPKALADLKEVTLVELFVGQDGGLSVDGKGNALTSDAGLLGVATNAYELHVFDTPAEAITAKKLFERAATAANYAVLATGEAALLCDSKGFANAQEVPNLIGVMPIRTVGATEIRICDERARDIPGLTNVMLSVDFDGADLAEWRAGHRPIAREVQLRHGHAVAQKMGHAMRGREAVRAGQKFIETLPGALVSMMRVSSECVTGALDEVAEQVGAEIVLPPEQVVHNALIAEAEKFGAGGETVIRRVAYSLLFGSDKAIA